MRHFPAVPLLFGIAFSSPSLPQSEPYAIPMERALCIQTHAEKYLENGRNPILIAWAFCPEHDLQKILSGEVKNQGGGSGEKKGSIGVIRISREDLDCFSRLQLPRDIDTYSMPKKDGWCSE